MNAFLTSMFLTLVCFTLDSGVNRAWAGTPESTVNCGPMPERPKDCKDPTCEGDYTRLKLAWDDCKKELRATRERSEKQCNDAIDDMNKKYASFLGACKQVARGERKCTDVTKACAAVNTTEQSGETLENFAQAFGLSFPASALDDDCMNADLTATEWKDQTTAARREVEEKKKEFKKLQDESTKIMEKATEAKAKIESDAVDLDEQFTKLQEEAEANGEKQQADYAEQARKSYQNLRDIETKNLTMINARAAKVQERAAMLEILSDAYIVADCTAKLQEFDRKYMAGRRGVISGGGAGGALGGATSADQARVATWNYCKQEAMARRESTLQKFKSDISMIDQEMKNLEAAYESEQTRINSMNQAQQRIFERQKNSNSLKAQNYNNKRQALMGKYQSSLNNAQQESIKLQSQLASVQSDLAKESNKLARLEKHKSSGDKTYKDIFPLSDEVLKARTSANLRCQCGKNKDLFPEECKEIEKARQNMKSDIEKTGSSEESSEVSGIGE
jgi:hypothetical protein